MQQPPPSQFTIRVYGILINQQQVLVSDEYIRGNYFTKFPGGGLEIGEGTKDCLVREFMEETSLAITVGEHLYTTDFFVPSAFNPNHQILSIYYYVHAQNISNLKTSTIPFDFTTAVSNNPNIQAESFRWINIQELQESDMHLPIDKVVVSLIKKNWSSYYRH
jgi:8-oxo-dGTP diphosphatase